MNEPKLAVSETAQKSESLFYSLYEWCLNPILTVRDLFVHLQEEIGRYSILPLRWEREESMICIYLFVCAIVCCMDDYISWRPWILDPIGDDFPQIAFLLPIAQGIVNLPYLLRSFGNLRRVRKWRKEWTDYVGRVCGLLLEDREITPEEISGLGDGLSVMLRESLPDHFMSRRMKLNEGYRCQDLTHFDILTLVDRFIETHPSKETTIVVIGPRTAGAYFAPVVKEHLSNRGFRNVSWITLRPKRGISREENDALRRLLTKGVHVVLTDDYSNTGKTFRTLQKKLFEFGVPASRITILAPIHPTKPQVPLTLSPETRTITLEHSDLRKEEFLEPSNIEPLLQEYLGEEDCEAIAVHPNPEVDEINARLRLQYPDSFQVRLKRVYEVDLHYADRPPVRKRVLIKSAGWGWLGYHAYIAGMRLGGSIPTVFGLRHGLLFTEWLEGSAWNTQEGPGERIAILSSYIIRRTKHLRLIEDPRSQPPDLAWGWLEILRILRRVYGVRFGYVKQNALISRLKSSICPVPSLIDGRMRPGEWLVTDRGIVKLDFEQHAFGAPEFDIVDPAYDLAGTSFEFHLSPAEQNTLVEAYVAETGDGTVSDRILLYKLLYAVLAMRFALEKLQLHNPAAIAEALNQRYRWCWNFLVYTMNSFSSTLIGHRGQPQPNGTLLFLDLDGVFDSEVFGFPHTTVSGLTALALLRSGGVTVTPNTGRSIDHVRNYCMAYGFPAGVAEYGSVIFDTRQQREVPLIDDAVSDQLRRCREVLESVPGVFIDRDYRYSVRAYRFDARGTAGLNVHEATDVLKDHSLDKLKCITRAADTYFVGADTGKGNAIPWIKDSLRLGPGRVIAIGDSDEDLPMLTGADIAYAPSNCSAGIRRLAKQKRCRIASHPRQRGLLEICGEILGRNGHTGQRSILDAGKENTVHNLMFSLLRRAEQSRPRRFIALLNRRQL
ncbi:MAG: HAD hydrolase family protein [Bacteroidota bacterium]